MLKPEEAWEIIKRNAEKAYQANAIWCSLVEIAPYRLLEVTDDYLLIKRLNGGENQKLAKGKVRKAAEKLLGAGGRMKRRNLISPTVAEETAFVFFHHQLGWSEDGEFITIIS